MTFEERVERCVVTNRVLLLGIDALYRKTMKPHERGELLDCAKELAARLGVREADVPVEGYYTEDESLTAYFRLMRALQVVRTDRATEVASGRAYQRLYEVTSSPIYGEQGRTDSLFPRAIDPLSQALVATRPEWNVSALTAAAHAIAEEQDDCSLVGLAATAKDSVALTALRESVVLYSQDILTGIPRREFIWEVEPALAARARRFVNEFNTLFDESLPIPAPEQAEVYWHAADLNDVVGRLVCLGHDESDPPRHYHWEVCRGSNLELTVHEFWDDVLWTTALHRGVIDVDQRFPEL